MRINQSAIKPYNTAKYELSYLEFAKLSQTNKVFVSKIEFIFINKSSSNLDFTNQVFEFKLKRV